MEGILAEDAEAGGAFAASGAALWRPRVRTGR